MFKTKILGKDYGPSWYWLNIIKIYIFENKWREKYYEQHALLISIIFSFYTILSAKIVLFIVVNINGFKNCSLVHKFNVIVNRYNLHSENDLEKVV